MSRDYTAIYASIWADPDWRKLTMTLQHTYLLVVTQPRLSPCGVLEFNPRRMGKLAADLTPDAIEEAVDALCATRPRPWLIYDDDTGELLVRSFVRHDGTLKMPNPSKSIARDWRAIASTPLKDAVLTELRRGFKDHPKAKGWEGIKDQDPELMALIEVPTKPLKGVA